MADQTTLIVAIGTENKAKVSALKLSLQRVFPGRNFEVRTASVASGVSNQPMSDEESILGATNRAKAALAQHADATFGVGMEGGLHKISDRWYECGWIAVVDRAGKVGLGSSARFECSKKIVDEILKGKELADVIDELTGLQDVRSSQGAMGIVTNGVLQRDECYTHGVIFAFAPFVSDKKYWE
eukprot:TRINITY_DN15607_c0_g1_i1.p1 TRINITY_DN15607_c0_g1~~TRINITY_DN15607_c0_g1_i1.p1  ORF type:complete len:194 (-),score=35.41 TRINITY_DN15607_c0_g1_i1:23-574(-)